MALSLLRTWVRLAHRIPERNIGERECEFEIGRKCLKEKEKYMYLVRTQGKRVNSEWSTVTDYW